MTPRSAAPRSTSAVAPVATSATSASATTNFPTIPNEFPTIPNELFPTVLNQAWPKKASPPTTTSTEVDDGDLFMLPIAAQAEPVSPSRNIDDDVGVDVISQSAGVAVPAAGNNIGGGGGGGGGGFGGLNAAAIAAARNQMKKPPESKVSRKKGIIMKCSLYFFF